MFKVGDEVVVKAWSTLRRSGHVDVYGDINLGDNWWFLKEMEVYCGEIAVITEIGKEEHIVLNFENESLNGDLFGFCTKMVRPINKSDRPDLESAMSIEEFLGIN